MAEKRRGARGHAVSARLKYNHQITDIGARQLDFVRKQIEWRASGVLPDERFVDVRYADLVRDPLAVISQIYDAMGWRLEPEVERTMVSYIDEKPRGSRGAHVYSLANMGLDPPEERERFRFYQEHFGVPNERVE